MRFRRFAAMLAAILCACSSSSPSDGLDAVVVGRIGAAPAVSLDSPLSVTPLKLAQEVRNAFRSPTSETLGVVVGRPANRILLSVGVRGQDIPHGPVRFTVRAKGSGDWQTVFSETVEDIDRWHDSVIGPDGIPAGAREFEFEVDSEAATEAAAAFFGSVVFSGRPDGERTARPNIVLISLDTLGAVYLGSEGEFAGVSPFIDGVLQRSGAFTRAFVQFGSTLFSHQSLFTGRYPSNARGSSKWKKWNIEPLVEGLADAGYLTVAVTENGFVSSAFGFATGFDRYDNGPLLIDEHNGRKRTFFGFADQTFANAVVTLQQLETVAPVFLFVHTYEAHAPYDPRSDAGREIAARLSPGDERSHRDLPRPIERPEDLRRLRALYVGQIRDLDGHLRDFFAQIDTLERADEMLVVLAADHGERFSEAKIGHGGLHNDVLRAPLGFYWPGHVPARENPEVVELIDVMPTILDFAGVPAGEVDGRSLVPLLMTGEDSNDDPASAFSLAGELGAAVQDARFKLIRGNGSDSEILYDLEKDPGETHDVAAQHPAETQRLRRLLDQRMAEMDAGPLPADEHEEIDVRTREHLEALGYVE